MQSADDRGVLLNYDRNAPKCDLTGIFKELYDNRKHNTSHVGGVDFLLATFMVEGIPWLIIGTNQKRTEEDIELEKTPFKTNHRETGNSRIAEKGYGAKLPDFKIRGYTSMLFQTSDDQNFSRDLKNWKNTRPICIDDLSAKLNSDKPFSINRFAVVFEDTAGHESYTPFFHLPSLKNSGLVKFIFSSSLKSFYVYKKCQINTPELKDSAKRLACIFEGSDVTTYLSIDGQIPIKQDVEPYVSLGLLPKYWSGHIRMFCKLGSHENKWKDTRFKTCVGETEWYGKLQPVSQKVANASLQLVEDKTPVRWEDNTSDISITVPYMTDEYLKYEEQRKTSTAVHLSNSDFARKVFVKIGGDILSDRPICDEGMGINVRTTLLSLAGHFRVIVDIMNAVTKDNIGAGIKIEPFKCDTRLIQNQGIHEAIKKVLAVFRRVYHDKIELIDALDSAVRHRKASKKRATEGMKYDKEVCDLVSENFDDFKWSLNDSHITSEYKLEGRGIDALGENDNRLIAIQVKNTATLGTEEVKKFVDTIEELRAKIPSTMRVYPFLIWKPVKDTSNISLANYRLLESIGAKLLLSDMDVCEKISEVVG